MLEIRNLIFYSGGSPLINGACLSVFSADRVGLVGLNGTGKSTLFRLIRAEIKPDGGDIALQSGKVLAFVEQEIINSERAALEFVLDGDSERRQLEERLASEHHDAAWFEAQSRFETIDGYGAPARAAQLLNGLGFASDSLTRPVSDFSGGWRMRLNLARALMRRADLLLLDEPTNHLDLEAILWLEGYLRSYPGAILLVSHDREFLNAVTTRIAHLHGGLIDSYTGDFDAFEEARAMRLAQQDAAFRAQQGQIAKLESFVNRFRAKATKARQAQSRLKALERLERIAPVHAESGHFGLSLEAPERSPGVLLRVERADLGYTEAPILRQVNFTLPAGARIALLGPNGAGKSTLVKLLAGELQPLTGRMEQAEGLKIGYFAQHQLEHLVASATPYDHLRLVAPESPPQVLRDFLGRFGLADNTSERPVATFSGGEKSRLALALLAWHRPHLLLLDEPTNHLDLDMRDALTLALEDYAGAMVLVSHDRSLIRATADDLWLVADGEVVPFHGDLEDYKTWLDARRLRDAPAAAPRAEKPRREAAPRRKALISRRDRIDAELSQLQTELAALQERLADPATYADPASPLVSELNARRDTLETRLATLEEEWLELEMALENAI